MTPVGHRRKVRKYPAEGFMNFPLWSEATKGLRYFIKIALIFKLCDPYYDFCLDFSFLLFLKFNGLFCFWDFDGLLK